jgi:hypothetical protein
MLQIKVFGPTPPCATCKRAEQEAREAAAQFPGRVEVAKLDAHGPEASRYGLMVTPMVVVGEQVVAAGRIVPASKLIPIIEKQIGA